MFCKHCGNELPDNAKFCIHCGHPCDDSSVAQDAPARFDPSYTPGAANGIPCPSCGSTNTEPMVHTTTQTKAGGYSCLGGACGGVLLGPVGLLLGLCGRSASTQTSSQTRWVCKNCGLEFPNKQDVQKAKRTAIAVAFPACIVAYVCVLLEIVISILGSSGVGSTLAMLGFLAIAFCLLFWITAREKSPYSLEDLLPNGEAIEWMRKYKAVKIGLIAWLPCTIALNIVAIMLVNSLLF